MKLLKSVRVICFAVAVIAIGTTSYSQKTHIHDFACSYYGESMPANVGMTKPDASAEQVIQDILSVVGLRPNFEIREANVPNAAAVILNSKRFILYNKRFMQAINSASGTDWAAISILAHEIGHHLNGHTLSSTGSRPDIELEADEFSGFVLAKMGASLSDAQAAMSVAASQKASHTHPAKRDRLVSIESGWKNANRQIASNRGAPKTSDRNITKPVMVKIPERKRSPIDEKYIAFDVRFSADSDGSYYITSAGNLITIEGESLYVIGRLAESNKRGYKLMLSDKNYNYLYIDAGGKIVNGSGKTVGLIRKHS